MSTPFILCENLIKVYKVAGIEVQALQGLDLAVNEAELLGVVGSSGSGKSTLLNILGGLDRPTAGVVWVGERDLLKLSDRALDRYRRETVGFVWQQGSRNLIPYLTAQENVELPMTLAGNQGRAARVRAEMLLQTVELGDRRDHKLVQLSGGEQQRVAIAVALANNPRLLLADEPTGEVDSGTAAALYAAFRNLNQVLGVTTLIVSHDPGIARHVDRVVAVRDGKLAAETVRRAAASQDGGEHHAKEGEEVTFQETIMLDSAGRLQLPKEFLQRYGIRRRAQLELTEAGILVRPVAGDEAHAPSARPPALEAAASPDDEDSPAERWQRFSERLLARLKKKGLRP